MTKKITVIIPCYNQGHYLEDALKSLEFCDQSIFDLIIVNDGSNSEETIEILKELIKKDVNVVSQGNKGLAEARNTGIKLSKTEFILPLDADNKILPGFMEKALEIMQKSPDVYVCYGNREYFGDKTGTMKPGKYNLQRIMIGNYIDACAVIRKTAFDRIGFYDNMSIMGYEDWDLWLRLGFAGYKFHYINETVFSYRVREDSMMNNVNKSIQKKNEIEDYMLEKYSDKLDFDYVFNLMAYQFKKNLFSFLKYALIKKLFPKYRQRMIEQNKMFKYYKYD